jgi:serine/threonine protein kinase
LWQKWTFVSGDHVTLSNILLSEHGQVRLADFGSAHSAHGFLFLGHRHLGSILQISLQQSIGISCVSHQYLTNMLATCWQYTGDMLVAWCVPVIFYSESIGESLQYADDVMMYWRYIGDMMYVVLVTCIAADMFVMYGRQVHGQ